MPPFFANITASLAEETDRVSIVQLVLAVLSCVAANKRLHLLDQKLVDESSSRFRLSSSLVSEYAQPMANVRFITQWP